MVGGKGVDVRLKHVMRKVDEFLVLFVYAVIGVVVALIIPFMFILRLGQRAIKKGHKTNWLKPESWF